jgi:hypothetical protein
MAGSTILTERDVVDDVGLLGNDASVDKALDNLACSLLIGYTHEVCEVLQSACAPLALLLGEAIDNSVGKQVVALEA